MQVLQAGVRAEFHRATDILMHEPGEEVCYGLLYAEAALYEGPFDRCAAIREHQSFVAELKRRGISVYIAREVLLTGTKDIFDKKILGSSLDELVRLAKQSLSYSGESGHEYYRDRTLKTLHPEDLAKIVVEKPTVHLGRDSEGKLRAKYYQLEPLCNLYFMRDQMIVTDKGVVLGKMRELARAGEVRIVKEVLRKLGIRPIHEVKSGCLEGGDFMPAGSFALIGQGLRTDAVAIHELLQHDVFGYDEVAVVKDPEPRPQQMHLDTYFNIVASNLALIEENRIKNPRQRPRVDIYIRRANGYPASPDRSDMDFIDYVTIEKGFNLIEIDEVEQLNYGVNIVCTDDGSIIGSKVSDTYAGKLRARHIDYVLLDFTNIRQGYGSNHCMTQVLHRKT